MGDKSKIEWTEATWNPATGCTKVSPGCAHCYIERTPPFRIHHRRFDRKGKIPIRLHPERLTQPFKWTRPRMVFVNSLSDLFHEDIPSTFIDSVFAVMAFSGKHTFQVLTKRPERMRQEVVRLSKSIASLENAAREMGYSFNWQGVSLLPWPIPNLWLGVTVENQRFADERIPLLLEAPAAVRFVSYEPALGPIDFTRMGRDGEYWGGLNALTGEQPCCHEHPDRSVWHSRIDWLIAGGESGPGARASNLDWFQGVRDQCKAAGVPFFMKQICERGRKIPFESWPVDLQVREFPAILEI